MNKFLSFINDKLTKLVKNKDMKALHDFKNHYLDILEEYYIYISDEIDNLDQINFNSDLYKELSNEKKSCITILKLMDIEKDFIDYFFKNPDDYYKEIKKRRLNYV